MSSRLIKLHEVIGDVRKGITGMIPMSRASWYAGIKKGLFPAPVKLRNSRSSYWRDSDIKELINSAHGGEPTGMSRA